MLLLNSIAHLFFGILQLLLQHVNFSEQILILLILGFHPRQNFPKLYDIRIGFYMHIRILDMTIPLHQSLAFGFYNLADKFMSEQNLHIFL